MGYEKLYKEALEKAKIFKKHLLEINDKGYAEEIDYIFPELKESEDERIRKWIIRTLKSLNNSSIQIDGAYEMMLPAIAWLEKQGEQKSVNNIKPKFKVGEWVFIEEVKGYKNGPFQIKNVDSFGYSFDEYHTIPFMYEDLLSKWTIKDAKDGDVLFTSSTASHDTFIFKSIDEEGNAKCYFAYDSEDGFREGTYHFIGRAINCKPATKEQRDLLFAKMKEVGYDWDAEKKQVIKL